MYQLIGTALVSLQIYEVFYQRKIWSKSSNVNLCDKWWGPPAEALGLKQTTSREDEELSFPPAIPNHWIHPMPYSELASTSLPQDQSPDKTSCNLMEIHIETLQRISCSRFAFWEEQLQSKLAVWWLPLQQVTSKTGANRMDGWRSKGRRVLGDTLPLWSAWRWAPDHPPESKTCKRGGTSGVVFGEVPRQGAWWLLSQTPIHSWSGGRTDLKFCLCLDLES